jgi:hypothetical protein
MGYCTIKFKICYHECFTVYVKRNPRINNFSNLTGSRLGLPDFAFKSKGHNTNFGDNYLTDFIIFSNWLTY